FGQLRARWRREKKRHRKKQDQSKKFHRTCANGNNNFRRVKRGNRSKLRAVQPVNDRRENHREKQRRDDGPFQNEFLLAPVSFAALTGQQIKTLALLVAFGAWQ